MATIGIVREWKTETERRAPLTPEAVSSLVAQGLRVLVEPSPHRVYEDAVYVAAGAEVTSDLSASDFVLGIKEMPIERIQAGKPHLFFSHTIKGQAYNMPLLRAVLEKQCTLMDYEVVTDDAGLRLIFFGVQAGQAGMINSLWTLGRRLEVLGRRTPLASLRQAREYASLAAARADLVRVGREIREKGLPVDLPPLVCGITGIGNVSGGAQEMLDLLDPITISPDDLLQGKATRLAGAPQVVKVVFDERDMVLRQEGDQPYSQDEYRGHPERYRGRFEDYLPFLSLLVAANYWDARYPRLVTRAGLREHLTTHPSPRLIAIGDISCDPEGGIECTMKTTLPDDPVYVYDPITEKITDGFEGDGIAVMAVDILPTELPREASEQFSRFLMPYVAALARADYGQPYAELPLPPEFRRAVIAHQGKLAPTFEHLL